VVLTIGTVCFLASLPLGYLSYRNHQRKDAAAASVTPSAARAGAHAPPQSEVAPLSPGHSEHPADPGRPTRLN
jgi:CDP-diacylglycerol--serine O-phosphatidyltransferase